MTAAATAATWDRLASRYARQEHLESRAIQTALRLAAPAPSERLVDLATGTGLLLRQLAMRPTPPREAIGVDRSEGMLACARPLPERWSTLLADAHDVPLPDGCANVVTCAYLLQLLSPQERSKVLLETRRLLAPDANARLVTVTVWPGDRGLLGRLVRGGMQMLSRVRPAVWGGLKPLDPTTDLTDAGFSITHRAVLPRRGYPSLVLAARLDKAGEAGDRDNVRTIPQPRLRPNGPELG